MSRRFALWLVMLLAVLGGFRPTPAAAQGFDYANSEFIILTGGPALREWEDLRRPGDQHDRWWGNFVRASRIRIQQIRRAHGDAARITWLLYRPAYVSRQPEDARRSADQPCSMDKILSVRDTYRLNLVWFDSGDDVIHYLNTRPRRSIVDFEYFGHSNLACFMFDYSNEISGASAAFLHQTQLGQISGSAFAKNAFCKSWGCHTGESMSRFWKKATGVPMEGALGKTDYSVIIDHVSLPRVIGRGWSN